MWTTEYYNYWSFKKNIKRDYKIGDMVLINPIDGPIMPAIVIGFQVVDYHYPIVEYEIDGKKGQSAFAYDRMNPFTKNMIREMKLKRILK